MREILFRGKRTDNGEWVHGDLIHTRGGHPLICARHDFGSVVEGVEVDYNTVCQYTGMNDKNGAKIFEGDIVNYKDELTLEVLFRYGMFELVETHSDCTYYFDGLPYNDLTVIGNIHDNQPSKEQKTNK